YLIDNRSRCCTSYCVLLQTFTLSWRHVYVGGKRLAAGLACAHGAGAARVVARGTRRAVRRVAGDAVENRTRRGKPDRGAAGQDRRGVRDDAVVADCVGGDGERGRAASARRGPATLDRPCHRLRASAHLAALG